VRFGAQFGMTKAWLGLRVLDELLTGAYAGSVHACTL
jgi:hypothetical protein